ncbi:hypothetical protein AAE478_006794 [Parahypoxylon ruwenzoriense]
MGLRLFVEPVESDVPPRRASRSPDGPAAARSPIRRLSPNHRSDRSDRRRQLQDIREHRLRMLTALTDREGNPMPLSRSNTRSDGPTQGIQASGGPYHGGLEDPDLVPESTALFHGLQHNRFDPNSRRIPDPELAGFAVERPIGSFADDVEVRRGLLGIRRSPPVAVDSPLPILGFESDVPASRRRQPRRAEQRPYRVEHHGRGLIGHLPGPYRQARRVGYVDGLGDRDRSLSPEGDGVWDILQSTLAPDPQPPSVGSSFESTNPSSTASQRTTVVPISASVTSLGEETEFPCDNEADGDDGQIETSRPRGARRILPPVEADPWLNYAEMAAATSSLPSAPDDPGFLDGMHRIVRGLAAREDIPDEWWAEAGLNRSMSWERLR